MAPAALTTLGELSAPQFVAVVAVAAILSSLVFWHANRRGRRHATAWGVAVFLFAGIAVPVYLLSLLFERRR